MRVSKDLVAAAATPLVLGILAEGESYGYSILQRIAELSDGQLEWSEGMLYPLLHRLERHGQIEAHWIDAPTGRRRKQYRLSAAGREAFAEQRRQWTVVSEALHRVWSTGWTGPEPMGAMA